ncbi:BrnT family toxin [Marinobacter sp.]|uniref:BrnT family toxin n=1 Tax=Marinobacter sp. TaxID=50741 RepID=UPI0019894A8A|nr:BrnT family toxin [Marinobacter sp.]MBC7194041.1 BrnT family toxin [Marinobacter sp.]
MRFEWDEAKNAQNIHKHGIDFMDAVDIFNHPMLTSIDDRYAYHEERWVAVGLMRQFIGVIVFVEKCGDVVRIISARKATRREVKLYEQNI